MANQWTPIRLGDVCTKIGSGATPRGGSEVYSPAGRFALIRSQNVHNDGFRHSGLALIHERHAAELENVEVQEGDVLLNITGDSVARVCQVDPGVLPARVNQHVAIIRPDPEKLAPRFLRYCLISPKMQSMLLSWAGSGGTRNALTKGMIESFALFAPKNVEEQRAIAHILGTLDDKIELNRRMNERLESIARALFKSWFVDFEPVRAKMEGKETGLPNEIAQLFPGEFEQSSTGKIPKGWHFGSLADVVEVARGISYKGEHLATKGLPMHNLNSIYEGGGYKYDGIKFYDGEYKPQHIARAGDLIVANTEQGHDRLLIGFAAIVPRRFSGESLFSHHIYRVRPQEGRGLTNCYLCHLLNSREMHDLVSGYANGTTVNMLPMDSLQKPKIVIPPWSLVSVFRQLVENILALQELKVSESQSLATVRDALLPKLISGELRVKGAESSIGKVT
jgi:type I restriction enzyme, S subunit